MVYILLNPEIPVDKGIVLHLFRYRCILCGRPANVIHEIIPKSQDPTGWRKLGNRAPVCTGCHLRIHQDGAKVWEKTLREEWSKSLGRYGYRTA